MQLDNIFEDLEVQFDFALETSSAKSTFESSNLARVRCQGARTVELIHPLIGSDFIAGMVLGANSFRLFRLASLTQIEFLTLRGIALGAVKTTGLSMRDFLLNASLPSEISWSTIQAVETKRGVVIDVVGELLMINMLGFNTLIGVPVAALSELQIHSVDNLNGEP
jgi:hypothetical protein